MLYPKNLKKFDKELFKAPTSEYRCTPFWAWNCELDADELCREIDFMKEMGMGGFHMHCRAGMSTKYLSDEFMELIKTCNEKAKRENMLAWLYDEDKWPSGFAGGYVTKNPEFRQKYLYFTTTFYDPTLVDNKATEDGDSTADASAKPRPCIFISDSARVHLAVKLSSAEGRVISQSSASSSAGLQK